MGRPLSRKYFGPQGGATADPTADGKDIHGTTVTSETGDTINENAYNMPLHMARIVGGQNEGGDDAPNDNLYIVAQKGSNRFKVSTSDGDRVAVRKINGSKAYDFDNNAYKWYIDNDSSRNVLILTAI
jgi:hypothetical protein